ncbi:MAG: HPF/RaiA family ribosome-associated protein [Pseudomonadota bacterium]
MSVHIQARGFHLTHSLERYTRERVDKGLGRYRESIRRLRVGLTDVNGPRGGADKCCQVHIAVPRQPDVVVKDTQANMYDAIDSALRRARQVLGRRFAKSRVKYTGRDDKRALPTSTQANSSINQP